MVLCVVLTVTYEYHMNVGSVVMGIGIVVQCVMQSNSNVLPLIVWHHLVLITVWCHVAVTVWYSMELCGTVSDTQWVSAQVLAICVGAENE